MKTTQLDTYKNNYKLREHQKMMLKIFKKIITKNFTGDILDIGCAQGVFLKYFKKEFPFSKILGIDTSKDLINRAKKLNLKDTIFKKKDFLDIKKKKFDMVTAAGVLGYYDNYQKPLSKMISLLKNGGNLIIFSHLNSYNIDTIVRFRNNTNCNKWERGLNSYSIHTIKNFLKKKKLIINLLNSIFRLNLNHKKIR